MSRRVIPSHISLCHKTICLGAAGLDLFMLLFLLALLVLTCISETGIVVPAKWA